MKIKTLLKIIFLLLTSGLLIAWKYIPVSSQDDMKQDIVNLNKKAKNFLPKKIIKLKQATSILSKFSANIEKIGEITPEFAKIISASAKKPLFVPKLIVEHAVVATGINFETSKAVVINSITGEEINACNKTRGVERSKKCKTKIIAANDNLKAALNIKGPIKGYIMKGDKKVEAKYIVTITAHYKGSHCVTTIVGDTQFEDCSSLPFIPWP
jgi:hypothetical protein